MNGSGRQAFALRGAAVLAMAAAIAAFAQPQAIASQQINLTLGYNCDFPEIGNQSATVEVGSDIPSSIEVGQPTSDYVVNASATAPWELTLGLHGYGVSTITGTVDGQAEVEAPQGSTAKTVSFDIHQITLPAFGTFIGTATGSMPEVTFSKPGPAEIIVGNLTMHLVLRDSNGNLTSLGEPTVPCTLNPGQNAVAASFTITGTSIPIPSTSPSTSATASPGPDPAPTVHTSSLSPSPSSHPSASESAGVSTPSVTSGLTRSVSPTGPGPSNGGDVAWVGGLGALAALVVIGAVVFRYGQRWRNR